MSRTEICEKLATHLAQHAPVSEECHVVYLMVETRKVIDQEQGSGKYPLLKFYADWAVHSRKDRITPEMKEIAKRVYGATVAAITTPDDYRVGRMEVTNFAYFREVADELHTFLTDHAIEDNLTTTKASWVPFVVLLIKVLENQPLVKPIPDVDYMQFEPAAPGCGILRVMFTTPVAGYTHFDYMNAFLV